MKISDILSAHQPARLSQGGGTPDRSFESLLGGAFRPVKKKTGQPAQRVKVKPSPEPAPDQAKAGRAGSARWLTASMRENDRSPAGEERVYSFDELGLLHGLEAEVAAGEVEASVLESSSPAQTENASRSLPTLAATTAGSPVASPHPAALLRLGASVDRALNRPARAPNSDGGMSTGLTLQRPGAAPSRDQAGEGVEATVRRAALKAKVQLDPRFNIAFAIDGREVRVLARARGLSDEQAADMADALSEALSEAGFALVELTINGAPVDLPARPDGA